MTDSRIAAARDAWQATREARTDYLSRYISIGDTMAGAVEADRDGPITDDVLAEMRRLREAENDAEEAYMVAIRDSL